MTLPKIEATIKTGNELFHENGKPLDFRLFDFWKWSMSDLVSNANRGMLAEFIVANALGIPLTRIREEWSAWDLTTPDGIKIEVKSSAYLQSWEQKQLSSIIFNVPKTRILNPDTNSYEDTPVRQADVYVFALLANKNQETLDPLDICQWKFFVLSAEALNERERSQKSITLQSLEKLAQSVTYDMIASAVQHTIHNNHFD